VCAAAKHGSKQCLSADNPAGHACSADGTRMTPKQLLAAAIGARPSLPADAAPRASGA
jgi:hypothetical protein